MNQNVIALVECSIKSGELENFKALVKEMVEATQDNEPGTLSYEFFYN
jgi:quinol monooxygenase YgiN